MFASLVTSSVLESSVIAVSYPFLSLLLSSATSNSLTSGSISQNPSIFFFAQLSLSRAALLFASIAFVSTIFKIYTSWYTGRLAANIGSDLAEMTFESTLRKPYIDHLNDNSSEVISAITTQLAQIVPLLNQLFAIASSVMINIGLISILFLINWQIAVINCGIIFVLYMCIGVINKNKLLRYSSNSLRYSFESVQVLQESLSSVRDIVINDSYNVFISKFGNSDRKMRLTNAQINFYRSYTRALLEGLMLVGISAIVFLSLKGGAYKSILPLLGVYALAFQKILPAAQQIYSGWASLKGFKKSYEFVCNIAFRQKRLSNSQSILRRNKEKIKFESLVASNISFRYPDQSREVLKDLSIEIFAGEIVGICGRSGSGKSTLIDILMGLLPVQKGTLSLNNSPVIFTDNSNLRLLQSLVAHVPQEIYLIDSTIAKNIAFGIPDSEINYQKIMRILEIVQLNKFIDSLDLGVNTRVGEGGFLLSGGQRQRVAIARSLYSDPSVLVLDEATSALDPHTEKEMLKAIISSQIHTTIIMVAHREVSLEACNRIFNLNTY